MRLTRLLCNGFLYKGHKTKKEHPSIDGWNFYPKHRELGTHVSITPLLSDLTVTGVDILSISLIKLQDASHKTATKGQDSIPYCRAFQLLIGQLGAIRSQGPLGEPSKTPRPF